MSFNSINSSKEFVSCLIEEIKGKKVAVFCGAGISIPSGLPSSKALVGKILSSLEISNKTPEDILNAIPFERFFEILLEGSLNKKLIDLFEEGSPSLSHKLIAKLAKRGLLKTICTTNFDPLIENALKEENLIENEQFKVFYREEDLADIDWDNDCIRLIKIHGSVEDKENMAITLKRVAGNDLSEMRKDVIDRMFSTGKHDYVLIMGYSCSDIFDINSQIEAISDNQKTILLVEHPNPENQHKVGIAEPIFLDDEKNEKGKNPFKEFLTSESKRTIYDTTQMAKDIWKEILDSRELKKEEDKKIEPVGWEKYIDDWLEEGRKKYGKTIEHNIAGLIYSSLADYVNAHNQFESAFKEAKIVNSKGFIINCLGNLGNNHVSLGRYQDAIDAFEEALKISRDNGNKYGISMQLANLGNIYSTIGYQYYIRAMSNHHEALKIAEEKGGDAEIVKYTHLASLGNMYLKMGDFEKAEEYYKSALLIAEKNRDKTREAEIRTNLGSAYYCITKYDDAMQCYKDALSISEKCGDKIGVGKQYANIGNTYCKFNKLQKGLEFFEKSKEILESKLGSNDFLVKEVKNKIRIVNEKLGSHIQKLVN